MVYVVRNILGDISHNYILCQMAWLVVIVSYQVLWVNNCCPFMLRVTKRKPFLLPWYYFL